MTENSPVNVLPGIGPAKSNAMAVCKIVTLGDLAAADPLQYPAWSKYMDLARKTLGVEKVVETLDKKEETLEKDADKQDGVGTSIIKDHNWYECPVTVPCFRSKKPAHGVIYELQLEPNERVSLVVVYVGPLDKKWYTHSYSPQLIVGIPKNRHLEPWMVTMRKEDWSPSFAVLKNVLEEVSCLQKIHQRVAPRSSQ